MINDEELCADDLAAAETQEILKQIVEELQMIKKQSERVLSEITTVHHQLDWKLNQVLNQPTSTGKPWLYVLAAVFTMLCLNLASVYYVASHPWISSPEFKNTYAFGEKMKSVWGKLSQLEKENLSKYLNKL